MNQPRSQLVLLNGRSGPADWQLTDGHAGTHHARYATLAVLGCRDHGLTAVEVHGHWRCRVCHRALETYCAGAPRP